MGMYFDCENVSLMKILQEKALADAMPQNKFNGHKKGSKLIEIFKK